MRWEAISAIAGVAAVIIGLIALFRDPAPDSRPVQPQQVAAAPPTTVAESTPTQPTADDLESQPAWRTNVEADGRCRYSVRNDLQGAEREAALSEARADCARRYPPFQVFPDYNQGSCRFTVRDDLVGWEREQAQRSGQEACDRAMASIGLRRQP